MDTIQTWHNFKCEWSQTSLTLQAFMLSCAFESFKTHRKLNVFDLPPWTLRCKSICCITWQQQSKPPVVGIKIIDHLIILLFHPWLCCIYIIFKEEWSYTAESLLYSQPTEYNSIIFQVILLKSILTTIQDLHYIRQLTHVIITDDLILSVILYLIQNAV